jgi:hypothetical protein
MKERESKQKTESRRREGKKFDLSFLGYDNAQSDRRSPSLVRHPTSNARAEDSFLS